MRDAVLVSGMVAAIMATGCGRAQEDRLISPPPFVAGEGGAGQGPDAETRLTPIQLEAEGAPPLVLGIYDRQEELECRFLLDEGGQLRCLPHSEVGVQATVVFADAACQDRIYTVPVAASAGVIGRSVVIPLPRVECAPRRHALARLEPAPSDAGRFGGADCAPVDYYALPSGDLLQMVVVSVESPERFEVGQEVDGVLVADRMRVREVETPDGARFVDQLIDEHFGKACTVQSIADSVWCAPMGTRELAGTKGPDCTSDERVWSVAACEEPAFLVDVTSRFAPGATWDGPVSRSVKGCLAIEPFETPDGMSRFVEAAAHLQEYDFMAHAPWHTGGTGRLQLRGFSGPDGSLVSLPSRLLGGIPASARLDGPTSHYLDTVTGTTCNPIRMPDGVVRCVPSSVYVGEPHAYAFADSACSEPAYLCPTYMGCSGLLVAPPSVTSESEVRVDEMFVAESVPIAYERLSDGVTTTCKPWGEEASRIFFVLGDAYGGWDQYPALAERR